MAKTKEYTKKNVPKTTDEVEESKWRSDVSKRDFVIQKLSSSFGSVN